MRADLAARQIMMIGAVTHCTERFVWGQAERCGMLLGMTPDEKFGQAVRDARESLGWSMTYLAARLDEAGLTNFHAATVGRMERAQRPVRLSEAVVIAGVLNRPLADLLGGPNEALRVAQEFFAELVETRRARSRIGDAFERWTAQKSVLAERARRVREYGVDRIEAEAEGFRNTLAAAEELLAEESGEVYEAAMHRRLDDPSSASSTYESPIGEEIEELEAGAIRKNKVPQSGSYKRHPIPPKA